MSALQTDYVEFHRRFLVTILAQNIHNIIFVLLWHWRGSNLRVKILPELIHVHHTGLTRWTRIVTRR